MTRKRLAFSLVFVGACLLVLIFGLWLSAGAVDAQTGTTTPVPVVIDPEGGGSLVLPSGSPWWAGIAGAIVGIGVIVVRSELKRRDKAFDLKIEAERMKFQVDIEQAKNEGIAESAGAVQIEGLTSALLEMAKNTAKLHTSLEQRITAQDLQTAESNRLREKNSEAQLLVAQSQERTTEILSKLETADEAIQGRKDAVSELKHHTEETVKPLDGKLKEALEAIARVEEALSKVITADQLESIVQPMKADLKRAVEQLEALQKERDSEPMPPSAADVKDDAHVDAPQ